MLLLFSQLGMSPFSLARPTKCSVPPPLPNKILSSSSFPSFSPTAVCSGQGGGGGLSTAFWLPSEFNVLFYLLWPGRGWPELGLLGPTPLDPSHHPHRSGTIENTQTQALKKLLILFVLTIHYHRNQNYIQITRMYFCVLLL